MTKPLCIGLVFTHATYYYRGVLRGIRRYLEANPQCLVTSLAAEHPTLRVPGRFRLDGLIASVNTEPLARSLAPWRRPVVNVSAVFPGTRFPRVGVDNDRVSRLAAAHFLERGLRKFAFIGPADYLFSTERGAAFCQAVREAGHRVERYEVPAYLPLDPLGQLWDLDRAVLRGLRRLPKPVGLLVPHDFLGVRMAEACRRAALRVPEDVALLGVDDDHLYCELSRPPLSSITVPAEQIGCEAAALLKRLRDVFLDQFIASFDTPPRHLTFDLDAADDPVYGQQQLTFWHGYYDQPPALPTKPKRPIRFS
jgi:LacI family transcriptional regulator